MDGTPSWTRILPYLLPYLAYVAGGQLLEHKSLGLSYPVAYALKAALTAAAIAYAWAEFCKHPFRIRPMSILLGIVGVVLWVLLVEAGEKIGLKGLFAQIGWGSAGPDRPAYDPFASGVGGALGTYVFLAIRLLGLALLAPIAEEFFLRGLLVRYAMNPDWQKLEIGQMDKLGWGVAVLFPLLAHPPGEALAVLAWFGMTAYWAHKTRNIWDCIAVHVTTNLLLGIYTIATKSWSLW